MSSHDLIIMAIIGGVFILLGITGILWGRKEEGAYYGTVSERIDVREFIDRNPLRPEPGALKIGGRICITVGIVLLLIAGAFSLWWHGA